MAARKKTKTAKKPTANKRVGRPARARAKVAAAVEPDGVLDAELFPTARAYAEEELHILSIARANPKLGARFIRDYTRRVEAKVPKKDRVAFKAAMSKIDVEARARVVVAKMEEYWGVPLDDETKENVRDDVRGMYAGD